MCRAFFILVVVALCGVGCGQNVCGFSDRVTRNLHVYDDRWEIVVPASAGYTPVPEQIDVYPRGDSPFSGCRVVDVVFVELGAMFDGSEMPDLEAIGRLSPRGGGVTGLDHITALGSVSGSGEVDGLAGIEVIDSIFGNELEVQGLANLRTVRGDVDVGGIAGLQGVELIEGDLRVAHGDLDLPALTRLDGSLTLDRTDVAAVVLPSLTSIGSWLRLDRNLQLTTFAGFAPEASVGAFAEIIFNPLLDDAAMRALFSSGAVDAPIIAVCNNGGAVYDDACTNVTVPTATTATTAR